VARYIFCSVLCPAIALVLAFPFAAASQALPVRTGAIGVRLETNQLVYGNAGEVMLRVTLLNRTAQLLDISYAPPYGLCKLVVLDDHGHALQSSGTYGYAVYGIGAWLFSPGEAKVVEFQAPERGAPVVQWAALKYWGYRLSRPGSYTIYAIPTIEARERINKREGPEFMSSPADRSNPVFIRVVK
jgi:hypothetical protein